MVPLTGPDRHCWGRQGEEWAAQALKKQGYKILARNYRTPVGEIDLVATKDGILVFVEVKLRRDLRFGTPQEGVTRTKRHHLQRAALYYLRHHHLQEVPYRFDLVAITLQEAGPRLDIIPDAFGL